MATIHFSESPISRPAPLTPPMHALHNLTLRSKVICTAFSFARAFSSPSLDVKNAVGSLLHSRSALPVSSAVRAQVSKASEFLLKEEWLESLSFPFDADKARLAVVPAEVGEAVHSSGSVAAEWVVGVDPDVSGAVALLKPDASGYSAQVFDTPHLQVLVGKRVRKRLDARSIIQLLQSFGAPLGMRLQSK